MALLARIVAISLLRQTMANEILNLTLKHPHYEDPKGGCRKDEEAVRIQGVQGALCSPSCSKKACPKDEPKGVTAKPQCALSAGSEKRCALICKKGDNCGDNASCKIVQGSIGICTYDDASANGPEMTLTSVAIKHPHYEDPKGGCRKDEQAVRIQGVQGGLCSPSCSKKACPSDEPKGVTAKPQCALSAGSEKRCALICKKGDNCGDNASCKIVQGQIGICTYDDASGNGPEIAFANLTLKHPHYEDPKGGCRKDEEAIRIKGVQGALCSPRCSKGECPTDEPEGSEATPQCALSTGSERRCAPICQKETKCGDNASCKIVQGRIGICTYDDAPANGPEVLVANLTLKHPHYEDPKGGCRKDEQAVRIQGVQGGLCSPSCSKKACPSDEPKGVTAKPQCALSAGSEKRCALICQKGDKCGDNASCKIVQGQIGICTYDDAVEGPELALNKADEVIVV